MKKILVTGLLFAVFSLWLNSTSPINKHVVKKGETLYSISKQYGVSIAEISRTNNFSTQYGIRIGQHLLIPTKNQKQQTFKYKPVSVPSTPDTPWREEDIRPRTMPQNGKSSAIIEQEKIMPKPQEVVEGSKPMVVTDGLKTSSSNAAEYPVIFNQYSSHGYKIKRNKGAANYLDEATSGNQNLAFYSNAEMGSVIRVTNLMNHKTVFVKVVGKVPPMDAGNEITLKLSSKAAKDLGALDEKFLVEVASFSTN